MHSLRQPGVKFKRRIDILTPNGCSMIIGIQCRVCLSKHFFQGERIHHRLEFHPPIFAFDQDIAIDAAIRYDILAGNDRHLFYLDHVNGSLFLEREIDLDAERSLPGNTFVLQVGTFSKNSKIDHWKSTVDSSISVSHLLNRTSEPPA